MPRRLHIGINALYLIPGKVGGTEIYLKNLLGSLAQIDRHNQYFVYTCQEAGNDYCPPAPNFESVIASVPASWRPARLLWEQTLLPLWSFRHRLDVLFSAGFSAPLVSSGRQVTVIHDMQHRRHPENFGAIERQAWNAMLAISTRSSDRIITVSENSRRDIETFHPRVAGRIRVIRHGVSPEFSRLREDETYPRSMLRSAGVPDEPFLLAVSTVHPHKNWAALLEAMQELRRRGRPEHLVVSGLPGKSWKAVQRRVAEAGLEPEVHLVGWQPRRVLMSLFRHAEALVFPSLFEGFGMPVLEAMATGLPVACSEIPPLREIADDAAWFFDPYSPQTIATTVQEMIRDDESRNAKVARGRAAAARFTWRRTAEETLALLLEVTRGGTR